MLRDFQRTIVNEVETAWSKGARNVMMVSPTGSGKTVMLSDITKRHAVATLAVAHRQELVAQLSLALNREGIEHGLIAPDAVQRQIVTAHMTTHGWSTYNPSAETRVAGVHSLARYNPDDPWLKRVLLAIIDEGHHVQRSNIWGQAMDMVPGAYGLFPTAHALRADGRGLGRCSDGLVDALVVGPSCREVIDMGLLTDYRLIAPEDYTDLSGVDVGASGEFSQPKLRKAVHQNPRIVGDVVDHYERFAAGKLGVTFAVDIESAAEIARAYQARNIPAEIITAETPIAVRAQLMRRFRAREILQLVSVDVLGEGVDVPAIEVISMARHTHSFQLYAQQVGRALRLMITPEQTAMWNDYTPAQRLAAIAASRKPKAIWIDHVNNWQRHNLPDIARPYSLNRRERSARKAADDAIPLRSCLKCLQPYIAVLVKCPNCGNVPIPQSRSGPAQVDGDLCEIDPDVLARMRAELTRIDVAPKIPQGADYAVSKGITNRHHDRQQAQGALRHVMSVWMGWQQSMGREMREAQKRFYFAFRVDYLSAQLLGTQDANELRERIEADLARNNIVEAK